MRPRSLKDAHPDVDRFDLSSLTRCMIGGQTLPVAKRQESSGASAARSSNSGA